MNKSIYFRFDIAKTILPLINVQILMKKNKTQGILYYLSLKTMNYTGKLVNIAAILDYEIMNKPI